MSSKKLNIRAYNFGGEKHEIIAGECIITRNRLGFMESISWCGYFGGCTREDHGGPGHGLYAILFSSKTGKYKGSYFVYDDDWRRKQFEVRFIKLDDCYYHAAMKLIQEYKKNSDKIED